jgi:hypothetical protein
MSCRSVSLSATSAAGFVGPAAAALRSGSPGLLELASPGLMSLTFGARLLSSALPLTEPEGSPAAARQFGATTGFGGAWLLPPAELSAGPLSAAAGAVALGVGSGDGAVLGAIIGGGVGGGVVAAAVGAPWAGSAAPGAAVAFGASGAPRSAASRAGVCPLGAPVANSHTDILPKVKPTVMPANKMAAAANVRRRNITGSLCI